MQLEQKIQVIDEQSGQTLYTCQLSNINDAYQFAKEMEENGFAVKIVQPTILDSLASELNLSLDEWEKLKLSGHDELEHHSGSCCVETTPPSSSR